ncbi:MAG: hypothetical protein A2W91_04215 [Bacteroidetes bacterium GWF2_38_335]|nr:MAG: hypothetical protein A2W91_04215 [Bacteroidetes bacterium GWF2_38_335]OFY79154.1 MAG: hypothetical protein A2281_03550 [Bacteroidetes bacterium RIFOXYA12_FULL_38_20]HBS88758.1 hypothetical protein [Bacteroidales bacterium]
MKRIIFLFFLSFFVWVSYSQNPVLVPQEGFLGTVTNIAYSQDGRYLASCGKGDPAIKIWEVATNKMCGKLEGHTDLVTALCFSPDGKFLASGSKDNLVILWDLTKWELSKKYSGHLKEITAVCFSGDGNFVVSASNDKTVKVWNISEVKEKFTLTEHKNDVTVVAVSSDNKYLVSGSDDNSLIVWDFQSGTLLKKIKAQKKRITSLAFLPNNTAFLSSSMDKTIKLWDVVSGTAVKEYAAASGIVNMSVESSGKSFFTVDKENVIQVWDVGLGSVIATINKKEDEKAKDDEEPIKALACNPNGLYFATAGYSKNIFGKISSDENAIKIWDVKSNTLFKTINGEVFPVHNLCFSPAGNILASMTKNRLFVWDVVNAEYIAGIEFAEPQEKKSGGLLSKTADALEGVKYTYRIEFTQNGEYLVVKSPDDNTGLKVYHFSDNQLKLNNVIMCNNLGYKPANATSLYNPLSKRKDYPVHDFALFPDSNYVAVGTTGDTAVVIFNLLNGSIFKMLETPTEKNIKSQSSTTGQFNKDKVIAITFSPDGKYLAGAFESGPIYVWETESWNLLFVQLDNILSSGLSNTTYIGNAFFEFSKDGKTLYYGRREDVWVFSYADSGPWPFKKIKGGSDITTLLSTEKTLAGKLDRSVCLYENESSKIMGSHDAKVTALAFDQKSGLLASAGDDGKIKVWDPVTGKEVFSVLNSQSGDYVFVTPDHYYKASKKGLDLVTYRVGKEIYPFEQFDLQYNRPGIILERAKNPDLDKITAYHSAYAKRLKKLKMDEKMFGSDMQIPQLSILNRNEIPYTWTADTLKVKVKCADAKYQLERLNIFINNVPIYGVGGLSLKESKSQTDERAIQIPMAAGKNIIRFSCHNQKGAESLMETIELTYEPKEKKKPDLYIVTIGASVYSDKRFNLTYASKDAKDMAELFKTSPVYGNVFTKTLTDNEVTKVNIQKVKAFLEKAGRDDVVILFIAGHGLLDTKMDYYFGTSDIDFNNPSVKGMEYAAIEALLDGLKALKKLLFMDTCHSGELDKDEVETASQETAETGDISFRNAGAGVRKKEGFGMKNTSDLMKELFTDLRKGTGSTVISSAGGAEFAMESGEWKNGLFTFCLKEALTSKKADLNNDGSITISELQQYVQERVVELSKGKQQPTSRIENLILDFNIW